MSLVVFINGARETVSPTPSTTLGQVLQTVCAKKKLDPAAYNLTYQGKVLDLSLSYRLSSLARGAKLEVKKKLGGSSAEKGAQARPSQFRIALQLPEGERLQGTFPSDLSLWDLLKHFEKESNGKLNLTEKVAAPQEDRGVKRKQTGDVQEAGYLQPVVVFMQSEISTIKDLKARSLGAIGVTDSSLLRVVFRHTGLSLEEVSAELANIEKENEAQQQESKEKMMEIEAEEAEKKLRMEALKKKAAEEEERALKSKILQEEEEEKARKKAQEIEDATMAFDFQAEYQAQLEAEYARMKGQDKEQEERELALWRKEQERRRLEEERLWREEKERKRKAEEEQRREEEKLNPVPEGKGKEKEGTPTEATQQQPQRRSVIPPRDPLVFPPAERPFDPREFEVPEDFFDLAPNDYSVFAASKQEEEKILRTKEMREKERLKKIGNFVKTVIRIRFPNRVELQGTFHPREKTSAVVTFVKERLEHPDIPFYLFTTPPKERVDVTKNMLAQLFVPAAIFYFAWEGEGPTEYLKKELMEGIEHLAYVPRPALQCSAPTTDNAAPATTTPKQRPAQPTGEKKEISAKEPPKWFTMGRKK